MDPHSTTTQTWRAPDDWRHPPEGFQPIDWETPLDVAAALARTPDSACIRGFNFNAIIETAQTQGVALRPGQPSFYGFKFYPMTSMMRLLVDAAEALHGHASLREGLRRLGWLIYPQILSSVAGRVIFSLINKQIEPVLRKGGFAYKAVLNHSDVSCLHAEPGFAVMDLKGLYNFSDSHHIGICEGALRYCNHEHRSWSRPLSPTHTLTALTWRVP